MRQTFSSDIAPGGCRSGGGGAPENVYKNEGFNKTLILYIFSILNFPSAAGSPFGCGGVYLVSWRIKTCSRIGP